MIEAIELNLAGARLEDQAIPPAVAMVISALEAGANQARNRRGGRRYAYRTPATLRLFSDDPATPPWQLYCRDVNRRGVGFVTAHRLPLGYGGILELQDPGGEIVRTHCTLLRCRQAAPGWYEGGLYFNREQMQFELR